MLRILLSTAAVAALAILPANAQALFVENVESGVASIWPDPGSSKVTVVGGELRIQTNNPYDTNGLHVSSSYQAIGSGAKWLNFDYRQGNNAVATFDIRANSWATTVLLNDASSQSHLFIDGQGAANFAASCGETNAWLCLEGDVTYSIGIELSAMSLSSIQAFGLKEDSNAGDTFFFDNIGLEDQPRTTDEPLSEGIALYVNDINSDAGSLWSGQATVTETAESVAGNTTNKIKIQTTVPYDSAGIHMSPVIDVSGADGALSFSVYQPVGANGTIEIRANNWSTLSNGELGSAVIKNSSGQEVSSLSDGWNTVEIDLHALGKTQLNAVGIKSDNNPSAAYYIDNVYLGDSDTPPPPTHNGQPISVDRADNIASFFVRSGSNWENKDLVPQSKTSGNFRILCGFASIKQTDPILQPDASPLSHHMHSFFGADMDVAVDTDRADLLAHSDSTCAGGGINKSLYWVPTMVSIDGDPTTDHSVIEERAFVAYYKTDFGLYGPYGAPAGLPSELPAEWFNLRMIAHKLTPSQLTALENNGYNDDRRAGVQWTCYGPNGNETMKKFGGMPNCGEGEMNLQLWFPQCLNLQAQPKGAAANDPSNYQLPNQENWLRYAKKSENTNDGCPVGGWVRIPTQSYSISWGVSAAGTSNWYLASDLDADGVPHPGTSRGSTAHGDFMNGWGEAAPAGEESDWSYKSVAQNWYEHCYLGLKSCHNQIKAIDPVTWRFVKGDTGALFTNR